jgi:hypothetical protein
MELQKLTEIQKVAVELKEFVDKQNLFTNIKGKNFVYVEGWQFAGASLGIRAVVEEVTNLNPMGEDEEIKYMAKVKLYHNDQVFGAGVATCSNKEYSKKSFDEYAVVAMAQTRAVSRAYRNSLGWIMKLAGYEATPYEEVLETPNASPDKKQAIIEANRDKDS